MSTCTAPDKSRSSTSALIVLVLAFAGIVVSLMQTSIIPLTAKLPQLLDTSASNAPWAVTATLLTAAVATPTVGRLGDMFGKRRMLLISLGALIAGSVAAALSTSLAPMLLGRTLQGLAVGVVPLGISIMRDELPTEHLGVAIALMSASLGVGGALGLPISAFLAQNADWHIIFWASSVLGLCVTALVLLVVPESTVRTGGRFDLLGSIGLSTALLCLLLAISKGGDWGWATPRVGGLIASGAVLLALWTWWELRATDPLVDLRTAVRRQVLLTNLASISFGFAMFAMMLVLPQLMQLPEATGYGLGESLVTVGLVMAPSGLVMMAVAPLSAYVSRTMGPKVTLMCGAVIIAGGYGLNIVLMSQTWQLVLCSSVIGCGVGLAYGALPALVMAAVPVSETAAANSLNTLMRFIGTSVSSAVAGAVLAQMTWKLDTVTVPSESGFRVVLAIGAGAALLALLVASFIPSQSRVEH